MDHLETPYDVEDEFIECTVCEKSIRGETLYKIHLTTPGHIKKEEGFVTGGTAVRRAIPAFKDILQYLDYLQLDEPIIGLQCLEQMAAFDSQSGPRYLCKLCHLTANLPEMVHHVIGRKHRQKYVEMQRPDLVTWDKQSLTNQGGKIMRAKAEIIERQDGRGKPLPIPSRGSESRLNVSKAPPKHWQNRDQKFVQTQQDVPSRFTGRKDDENKYAYRGNYSPEFSDRPPFHQEEPYMERERMPGQWEDKDGGALMEEERHRGDFRENIYRGKYMAPDNGMKYVEDPQGSTTYEPGGDTWYYPQEEEPVPHGHKQQAEYFPEKAVSYRRPYPERDHLKEFYSEEVRRQQVRSEFQRAQRIYPEDQHQRSLDGESVRQTSKNRASMQGFSEPEAKRHYIAPIETNQSHALFNVIKDYQHKLSEPFEEPGPSINVPPSSERKLDITKSMSGIPEPFRRFLTGATNNEPHGKRKRKSRFTDATAEEVEMTKEMIRNEFGLTNPKFSGPPTLMGVPRRPETPATHYGEFYTESQIPHLSDGYHGGGSDNVFDILKGLEIENAEDADFLKNKLCSLLKEFKAKKTEKALQMSQGGNILNKDYNRLNPDQQLSSGYDGPVGEDLDLRRPRDLSFIGDHRRRSWKQQQYQPDEQLQEHHHSVYMEPEHTYRSHYEDGFGTSGMSHTLLATFSDDTPRHPLDHRPTAKGYFDSHSPSPSRHMEEGRRMHRGPHYSNNLDKITSTLLELVARK